MSQVAKIHRVSFRGVPAYLGEHNGTPLYSGNPEKVANWLCDAFRTRFNQHRSQRSKYVYQDGKQLLDLGGDPLLTPIGNTVTLISDKHARQQYPHLSVTGVAGSRETGIHRMVRRDQETQNRGWKTSGLPFP